MSGGMDSVSALYQAEKVYRVVAGISFDYGAKHNPKELPFARLHCQSLNIHHEIVEIGFMDRLFRSDLLLSGGDIPEGHYEELRMKQTVVPFRNGIMLAIAAGYAESMDANGLVIAAHAGDHAIYPDCRGDFMTSMADAIRQGTYAHIQLICPFISMTKVQVAQCGKELGIDFGTTWSCYKGLEFHCGKCGTCIERREAFVRSGIEDPTTYLSTPPLPRRQNQSRSHPVAGS